MTEITSLELLGVEELLKENTMWFLLFIHHITNWMILIRIQIKMNQIPSILQSYAAFLNDFVMPLISILTCWPETEVLVVLHISIHCSQQQKQAFILINPRRSSLYSSLCRQPPLTSICLWALLWQRSLARSLDGWLDGWTPAFIPSHSSHE